MKNLIVNFLCQKFVTILQYFTILKQFDITLTLFVRQKYIIFDINSQIFEKFEKKYKNNFKKKQAVILKKQPARKQKSHKFVANFLLF